MHNLLRKDEYHNVFVAMCPHISKENIMTRKYYYDTILCYYDIIMAIKIYGHTFFKKKHYDQLNSLDIQTP